MMYWIVYTKQSVISLAPIRCMFTGQTFGLKANRPDRQLWLACTEEGCSLGGCPGNRFKSEKRGNCTEFQFTFETLNETDCVRVGDEVILKVKGADNTLYCGSNGTCVPSIQCKENGKFSREKCQDRVFFINVSSKANGERIKDRDYVSLVYSHDDSKQQSAMLICETSGGRKCRQRECSLNQAQVSSTTGPITPTPTTAMDGCFDLLSQFIVYKFKSSWLQP